MAKYGTFKTSGWGSLGKDPILSVMPNGDPVCNFSLAAKETCKDNQNGQDN